MNLKKLVFGYISLYHSMFWWKHTIHLLTHYIPYWLIHLSHVSHCFTSKGFLLRTSRVIHVHRILSLGCEWLSDRRRCKWVPTSTVSLQLFATCEGFPVTSASRCLLALRFKLHRHALSSLWGCFLQLWLIKHVALWVSLDVGFAFRVIYPQ